MSDEGWQTVRDTRFDDRRRKTAKHHEQSIKKGAPLRIKRKEYAGAAAAAAAVVEACFSDGYPNKEERIQIARDTVDQLKDDEDTWKCYENTVVHQGFEEVKGGDAPCVFYFESDSTLAAILKFYEKHKTPPCALNFASAKHPGGGFLRGSNAQEESLCKSSGLYWCLYDKQDFYKCSKHDARNGIYYDKGIYSPDVPIIKNDFGKEVTRHYANFLTVAAVNRLKNYLEEEYDTAMQRRCDLVLNLAAYHGQRHLILGAFGCGVFKNNPRFVARAFARLLKGKYKGYFDSVTFAIPGERTLETFRQAFE